MEEEYVFCEMQQLVTAPQAAKQAQLAHDDAKAAEEAATRYKVASQSAQKSIKLKRWEMWSYNKPGYSHSSAQQLFLSHVWRRL